MNLLLEIITPEKVIYKDEVSEIIAPAIDGEITILPGHIDLLTQIKPGELIVRKGASEQSLAVTGGFLEITSNKVSVLAEYAVKAQDVEVAKAMEAKRRAEKMLNEKTTDKELKIAEAEMIKAILQLKIATKRKHR